MNTIEVKTKKRGRPRKTPVMVLETDPDIGISLIETDISPENFKSTLEHSIGSSIKSDEITWFTEVDYNKRGEVAADYPAWYYKAPLQELKEEIRVLEQNIEDGFYEARYIKDARSNLAAKKTRYRIISEGKPKFSGKKKDEVWETVKEFEKTILESRFTYDECWNTKKNQASPHEEARRMSTPCIKVPNQLVADYFKQAGKKIVDGKVSRDQAIAACAVIADSIGERINVNYR